jgi:hypothetical protein
MHATNIAAVRCELLFVSGYTLQGAITKTFLVREMLLDLRGYCSIIKHGVDQSSRYD